MTQKHTSQLIDPYCIECHREARILKIYVEPNPGQREDMYISECCHANLVTWNRQSIPYGTLCQIYVDQQSWEVTPDD